MKSGEFVSYVLVATKKEIWILCSVKKFQKLLGFFPVFDNILQSHKWESTQMNNDRKNGGNLEWEN